MIAVAVVLPLLPVIATTIPLLLKRRRLRASRIRGRSRRNDALAAVAPGSRCKNLRIFAFTPREFAMPVDRCSVLGGTISVKTKDVGIE